MTQASYELPPTIGPQLLTEMAQTLSLQVTKQSPTHITLEGREDALEAFSDRLEQLLRLCGLSPAGK